MLIFWSHEFKPSTHHYLRIFNYLFFKPRVSVTLLPAMTPKVTSPTVFFPVFPGTLVNVWTRPFPDCITVFSTKSVFVDFTDNTGSPGVNLQRTLDQLAYKAWVGTLCRLFLQIFTFFDTFLTFIWLSTNFTNFSHFSNFFTFGFCFFATF